MLAAFCLRLALGLLAGLLLLSPKQLHPRFFRTHFLTALGLMAVAAMDGLDGVIYRRQVEQYRRVAADLGCLEDVERVIVTVEAEVAADAASRSG